MDKVSRQRVIRILDLMGEFIPEKSIAGDRFKYQVLAILEDLNKEASDESEGQIYAHVEKMMFGKVNPLWVDVSIY